jgi:hypothetical protein
MDGAESKVGVMGWGGEMQILGPLASPTRFAHSLRPLASPTRFAHSLRPLASLGAQDDMSATGGIQIAQE